MLVLSRKQSQRIRVGDSVIVTVVRVSGDKVRIGIEAPADVRVLRDELDIDDQIELPLTALPIGRGIRLASSDGDTSRQSETHCVIRIPEIASAPSA